jgi:hypothetical protein
MAGEMTNNTIESYSRSLSRWSLVAALSYESDLIGVIVHVNAHSLIRNKTKFTFLK